MRSDEDGAPGHNRSGRFVDRAFLVAATAAVLIARIPVMGVRAFDPDEFEHAHAAWSVFRGLLPYRDFFEHHTPWYYFALAPFFRWFPVDQTFEAARRFLIFGRAFSLGVTALSVVLAFLAGRLATDRRGGLLTALFLASQPVIFRKTLEIRPDVLALTFFVGALWLLLRAVREEEQPAPPVLGWFLGGGLCLGAAIMCTQKMLFALPGAFAGLGLWAWAGRPRSLTARLAALFTVVAGVALPGVVTWLGFALRGSGHQFIYNNFLLNAGWRMRSDRHLLIPLKTSSPILVLAVLGAASSLRRFWRARVRQYGDVVLLSILAGLIAGIPIVPAAYEQYYLPALAIACLFAAKGLLLLVERAQPRIGPWVLIGATLPLLIWPVVELGRSFGRRNDAQLARLRYVFEHTAPTDAVLDGWMGTDVFRPNPLYYFFMHRELLAMLSERDRDGYVGALESGRVRPALITLDDELVAVGPRLVAFVRAHYTSSDGLFYFPRR